MGLLLWGCCSWVSGQELCTEDNCCHISCIWAVVGPQSCLPAPFWHQLLHYIFPFGANMRPWAASLLHWVTWRQLGRAFAQYLWWLGKLSCPTELEWVVPTGDLEWLVQWELCCQHWGAAVKFPAVTLRRVSSLHVIDGFEKWQIYWCPDSLQPLRRLIVYLIISWTAKTDAVAADNRERNGANDECSNTSPHWTKAASMHCGTAFFVL